MRVFPIQIGDTTYYDSIWAIEGPISHESQIDPEIVSKFQQTQLRAVNIMQKIHSLMPGWENCYIARTADRTGIQRTRFLKGVYQLKEWDIKNAAVFEMWLEEEMGTISAEEILNGKLVMIFLIGH